MKSEPVVVEARYLAARHLALDSCPGRPACRCTWRTRRWAGSAGRRRRWSRPGRSRTPGPCRRRDREQGDAAVLTVVAGQLDDLAVALRFLAQVAVLRHFAGEGGGLRQLGVGAGLGRPLTTVRVQPPPMGWALLQSTVSTVLSALAWIMKPGVARRRRSLHRRSSPNPCRRGGRRRRCTACRPLVAICAQAGEDGRPWWSGCTRWSYRPGSGCGREPRLLAGAVWIT